MPQYDYYCTQCTLEVLGIENGKPSLQKHPDIDQLIKEIEKQKKLLIDVATGGLRIQEKNDEYKDRRLQLKLFLKEHGLPDVNPYDDLWSWYGKWSSGDLPTYQSRRTYINELYKPLLDTLTLANVEHRYEPIQKPTGWSRVDRCIDRMRLQLETAKNEEEFQILGLLCRETLISLAQAVYKPGIHKTVDNVEPSATDANRMLEAYFTKELGGESNENARRHAKAALALANELQHRRTANFREAAICAEATRTVVNIVSIISGRKEA